MKPQVGKINNLEDVNLVLKEIGLLERELEGIDAEVNKQIIEIKAMAIKKGKYSESASPIMPPSSVPLLSITVPNCSRIGRMLTFPSARSGTGKVRLSASRKQPLSYSKNLILASISGLKKKRIKTLWL
jgi:hypothetical protein